MSAGHDKWREAAAAKSTHEPVSEAEVARANAAVLSTVLSGLSVGAAIRISYRETDADAHAEDVWHVRYDGQDFRDG